jgi:hypothetical protein
MNEYDARPVCISGLIGASSMSSIESVSSSDSCLTVGSSRSCDVGFAHNSSIDSCGSKGDWGFRILCADVAGRGIEPPQPRRLWGFHRRRFCGGWTEGGFGVKGFTPASGFSITASYNVRPGTCVSRVSRPRGQLRRVGRVRRTTERWRRAAAIDTVPGQPVPTRSLRPASEAASVNVTASVAAPPQRPLEFGDPREPWLNLIADLIFDDLQRKRPP